MCTLIYVRGLPINAFRDLIYRYFYAKGDTLTPFRNSLLISFLNIVISIILARFIGIYGIVLGTVITSETSFTITGSDGSNTKSSTRAIKFGKYY